MLHLCITAVIISNNRGSQNSSVSSVLGLLFGLIQCCGFDPRQRRIFPVEEILELTWVLTPFPKNSFR